MKNLSTKRSLRPLSAFRPMFRRMKRGLNLTGFAIRQRSPFKREVCKINLCSGNRRIPGYFNVDIGSGADLTIDLAKRDLPFPPNSVESLVCMSAINYFTRSRASELIRQCHDILSPGGIARFGVQDLETLARRYVRKDREFFFQKGPDGKDRFEGPTIGDKFAAWFYGYVAGGYPCRYFYDYESLAFLFRETGFSVVERRGYRDSRLEQIESIDNRPEQMFFLEAIK